MPVWAVKINPEAAPAHTVLYDCGHCAVEAYRNNPYAQKPDLVDDWDPSDVIRCDHGPKAREAA